MLLWILRAVFVVTLIGTAVSMAQTAASLLEPSSRQPAVYTDPSGATRPATPTVQPGYVTVVPYAIFLAVLLFGVGVIALDRLIPQKEISTLSAVYFGLLLGLLLGNLLMLAIWPVVETDWTKPFLLPMRILITLVFCYVCVSTLYQTKDNFRFIIPYVEFSKQVKGGRPVVLDTSVIIDGRIADICETRIIDSKLIVPRFVLQELQNIADSPDKLRRNRGRRGLDILKRLQSNPKIELEIHEANLPEVRDLQEVDQRLVALAKSLGARVVTNDFNLNKIAQLQGVEVVNINELANALKSVALPGETITVRLIKPGDQFGQGVGYLDDGTMVVAEQGRGYIGQEVQLTVTSVLQTPAGRMIFGRIESRPGTGRESVEAAATSESASEQA